MLKKRLVPKLLIRHRSVGRTVMPVLVTTRAYRDVIEVGDPVSQAKIYEAQLADELMILNIDGTAIAGDEIMQSLIERLAVETFMPLCVGGGVRGVDDFGLLLQRGADKVSVNSAALADPTLIPSAADRYGSQCVVVSIDYRRGPDGVPRVWTGNGAAQSGVSVLEWALRAEALGAGELLLCDADRDGGGGGLDLETCTEVSRAVRIPVIASGGCGLAEHFCEGFLAGAEAVSAGTYFCFRDQNPMQTRAQIRNAGIPIRTET
jgi:cyclase